MWKILPKDDPNQALRIRRFLMAAASYAMWMVLFAYCCYQGLTRITMVHISILFSLILLMNIAFYIIFRTGVNKRFKDASLTMPQMIAATFWIMVTAYYTANEVRGIVLLSYLVAFVFGVFRLHTRQFFILTFIAMAGYGFVIFSLLTHHHEINLQIEILRWIVLTAVLAWFSLIGSYIYGLRKRVVKTNSELSTAMETIEQIAIHDELTEVYNRRHMFTILKREKALADRGNSTFSFCILDIDDFKRVNDTYGHLTGDMVLRTLARAIQEDIREEDYLARYGGDEFILILAYSCLADAVLCAQRIRKLSETLSFQDLPESFQITISIGVTVYKPFESIDDLLTRADHALYRAKANGRNRIEHDAPADNSQPHLQHPPELKPAQK
ncbi:MAG: GGDEF domain-containing protein [Thermodesulfobacteriota bacterium]|nr:GGDEF domain-containing protein [Thermodesulfobacteriota bacterium]